MSPGSRKGGRKAGPALREHVASLTSDTDSPAAVASAVEFILEGLHLSNQLNKNVTERGSVYGVK